MKLTLAATGLAAGALVLAWQPDTYGWLQKLETPPTSLAAYSNQVRTNIEQFANPGVSISTSTVMHVLEDSKIIQRTKIAANLQKGKLTEPEQIFDSFYNAADIEQVKKYLASLPVDAKDALLSFVVATSSDYTSVTALNIQDNCLTVLVLNGTTHAYTSPDMLFDNQLYALHQEFEKVRVDTLLEIPQQAIAPAQLEDIIFSIQKRAYASFDDPNSVSPSQVLLFRKSPYMVHFLTPDIVQEENYPLDIAYLPPDAVTIYCGHNHKILENL